MSDFHLLSALMLKRAKGCMMGQLAGDALGSLVEFRSPGDILTQYPQGVRRMADGGTFNTIAGQPTDDGEMALALARTIIGSGRYDQTLARNAYVSWLNSHPFDCGNTIRSGLQGRPNMASEANGALMRISPLGIFGARARREDLWEWARLDAEITHPNPICSDINVLFADAIAEAISTGCKREALFDHIERHAIQRKSSEPVIRAMDRARTTKPAAHGAQQGWVLIAFQNALYQLLHAPNIETAIVETIMLGGDTDSAAKRKPGPTYPAETVPHHQAKSDV